MFRKTTIVLSGAIVLSVSISASAATKHHRASHVHSTIYNSEGGGCTASGGPACSGACLPSGPPCAPPDVRCQYLSTPTHIQFHRLLCSALILTQINVPSTNGDFAIEPSNYRRN